MSLQQSLKIRCFRPEKKCQVINIDDSRGYNYEWPQDRLTKIKKFFKINSFVRFLNSNNYPLEINKCFY